MSSIMTGSVYACVTCVSCICVTGVLSWYRNQPVEVPVYQTEVFTCVTSIFWTCVWPVYHTAVYACVSANVLLFHKKKKHMLGEVSIHQTTVHIFFFSSMSFTSVITVMSLPRNSSIHLGYKCVMWLCDTGVLWLYGDKPSDIPKFAWQQCGETGLHCGVCGQPCGG